MSDDDFHPMTKPKSTPKGDEWHTEWLSDGRFGIFKNGICQRTFRSDEEMQEWWRRNVGKDGSNRDAQAKGLERAIERMG